MRSIPLFLALCHIALAAFAQNDSDTWQVGAWAGLRAYRGDLSTARWIDPQAQWLGPFDAQWLAYGLSLDHAPKGHNTWRLRLSHGDFSANDRSIGWDGQPYSAHADYGRALNVRSRLSEASLQYLWRSRQPAWRALPAPYLGIGIAYARWENFADLYAANGQRYFYWPDGSIRDAAPGTPTALVIEQDGEYETALRPLRTEGRQAAQQSFSLPLSLGLRWRLAEHWHLSLEAQLSYAFSDALDDVAGAYADSYDSPQRAYAANPSDSPRSLRGSNDGNDWYGFFALGIQYGFGRKAAAFQAPRFYLGEAQKTDDLLAEMLFAGFEMDSIERAALRDSLFAPAPTLADGAAQVPGGQPATDWAAYVDSLQSARREALALGQSLGAYRMAQVSAQSAEADTIFGRSDALFERSARYEALLFEAERAEADSNVQAQWRAQQAALRQDLAQLRAELRQWASQRPDATDTVALAKEQAAQQARIAALEKELAEAQGAQKAEERGAETIVVPVVRDTLRLPDTLTLRDTLWLSETPQLPATEGRADSLLGLWAGQMAGLADKLEAQGYELRQVRLQLQRMEKRLQEGQRASPPADGPDLLKALDSLQAELAELRLRRPDTVRLAREVAGPLPEPSAVNVFFEKGQSAVAPSYREKLAQMAALLGRDGTWRLQLSGYADASGPAALNFKLSAARVEAVRAYLLALGVPAERMLGEPYGSSQAQAADDPFARRVEVRLLR